MVYFGYFLRILTIVYLGVYYLQVYSYTSMKFINRKEELRVLEEKWESKTAQFFVMYGKRRVGKTELVKQFLKNKPGMYFLADKRNHIDQLKELGRVTGNYFEDAILTRNGFFSWLEFFEYISKKAKDPLVVVIDEYPYLVETDAATSSLFQKGWDEYGKKSKIFLILLGSSISMMESEVLAYKAPLFGRRTGQMLVDPMTFEESRKFFPGKAFEACMSIYAITGGMPMYLSQIDSKISIKENIKKKIFPHTEFLHNEVEFMLKEELREPKNYLSILKAISWGKRKFGEIANETGLKKSVAIKYLSVLERLRLVEKEVPVTEKHPHKSRKGLYILTDNFFRFWFQYIFPFKSDLEIGRTEYALGRWEETFSTLEGLVYERVCRELLMRMDSELFPMERIGKWWEREKEIDAVGLSEREKKIVFAECKWSNKKVGTNILEDLREKSQHVDWHQDDREEYFVLFSKSGFTANMKRLARENADIVLVEGSRVVR